MGIPCGHIRTGQLAAAVAGCHRQQRRAGRGAGPSGARRVEGVQRGRRDVLLRVGRSAWPAVGRIVVGGEAPWRPSFGGGERAGE